MQSRALTICFDGTYITFLPGFLEWLQLIGAQIEEGKLAVVSLPATTQLVGMTPRNFRIFEPGIAGELIVNLELNAYDTSLTFSDRFKEA